MNATNDPQARAQGVAELEPQLLAEVVPRAYSPARLFGALLPQLLPVGTKLLDLGCREGVFAVDMVQILGFEAVGVDFDEDRIAQARSLAEIGGITERCRFHAADVRKGVPEPGPYDVVVLPAVAPSLGTIVEQAAFVRPLVKPSGLFTLECSFLADGVMRPPPGYETIVDLQRTRGALTAQGDEIVFEVLVPPDVSAAADTRNALMVRRAAERLGKTRPDLVEALEAYAERYAAHAKTLAGVVIDALFVVRRAA